MLGDRSRNERRSPTLRSRPDPSFRTFDGHHEGFARIERAPQPGDERAHAFAVGAEVTDGGAHRPGGPRSEEHTSELQSLRHLVCRLLLEKKKNKTRQT